MTSLIISEIYVGNLFAFTQTCRFLLKGLEFACKISPSNSKCRRIFSLTFCVHICESFICCHCSCSDHGHLYCAVNVYRSSFGQCTATFVSYYAFEGAFFIFPKRQHSIWLNVFFVCMFDCLYNERIGKGTKSLFLLFIMGQPLVGQIYFCWCITAEVPQVEVALE